MDNLTQKKKKILSIDLFFIKLRLGFKSYKGFLKTTGQHRLLIKQYFFSFFILSNSFPFTSTFICYIEKMLKETTRPRQKFYNYVNFEKERS